MTWPEFVLWYAGVSVVTLIATRRLLSGSWNAYMRVCIFSTALCLLVNDPAESRRFWIFHRPMSGWTIFNTPLENCLAVVASASNVLVSYLAAKRLLPRESRG